MYEKEGATECLDGYLSLSFTFPILIPFTLALKRNIVQVFLNPVFLANTYSVEPVILATTSCCCARETQLFHLTLLPTTLT